MQIYTVGYFKVQLNLGILHSVISSYQSSSLNISHDIDMTDVMAQHSSSLSCPAQIGLLLNIQSDLSTVSPPPQDPAPNVANETHTVQRR